MNASTWWGRFFFPSHLIWIMSCFVLVSSFETDWNKSCLCEAQHAAEMHHAACSIVYLRKKKPLKSVLLDSHLKPWALAACWLLKLDCPSLKQNRAVLRWCALFPNFFSGISFYQLSPPTLHSPSSSLSFWRPCQVVWHMKTIVLACLRRHNCLLALASFSPAEAQLTVKQTDFLYLLFLLFGKAFMFSKIRRKASQPGTTKWLTTINIFDMQVEPGAISPASECLKHAEADSESKSH